MHRRRDGVRGYVAYGLHAGILIKPGQMRSHTNVFAGSNYGKVMAMARHGRVCGVRDRCACAGTPHKDYFLEKLKFSSDAPQLL